MSEQRIKKKYYFYILGFLVTLGLVLYYIFNSQGEPKKNPRYPDYLSTSREFIQLLATRWKFGDIDKLYEGNLLNCPEHIVFHPQVHKNYLSCNPRYIECFLKNEQQLNNLNFSLKKVLSYQPFQILIGITQNGKELSDFKLHFTRNCHQVVLPERQFRLESLGDQAWSSFGRKIIMDKFLVSLNDIELWRGDKVVISERGLPALQLSEKEQRQYCFDQGKKLMAAHVFEAATRFPPSALKAPYPWGHFGQNSKYALKHEEITESHCRRSFLSECLERKIIWKSYDTDSVSWAGLHDVFGGPPERVDNFYQPELSLKKADWTISFKSDEARIGFKKNDQEKPHKQIGFRCYQEAL